MRSVGIENVVIDVLEECLVGDMDALSCAEEFWITQIRSFGHRLTNLNSGGKGGNSGWRHTEESRAKISQAMYDLGMKGEDHPNWGRTFSEEHRKNISLSGVGRNHTEATKSKMRESWSKVDQTVRISKVVYGNHIRWHINRNTIKDGCIHCIQ